MTIIKKLLPALAASLLCLTGCGKYSSHYNAVAFVHSNLSDSAYMDFGSFDGTMVFTLDNEKGSEGKLRCSASLASGSAEVWCDRSGTKEKLFSLRAGDDIPSLEFTLSEEDVYVIVETRGECTDGKLEFGLL